MIGYESLQKRLVIAAIAGMLMLLLATSSVAQTSLDLNGPENCTDCSENGSAGQTKDGLMIKADASSSPRLEDVVQEMNSSYAPARQNLKAPELVLPSKIVDTGIPTYRWKNVDGCQFYCLEVKDDQDNVVLKQWYESSDFSPNSGECSATPLQSLNPGDYKWRIQSWSCLGHKWSSEMDFTVRTSPTIPGKATHAIPGKATLVSPQYTIGTKNPTFIWTPVKDASEYCLKVAHEDNPDLLVGSVLCYKAYEVLSDQGCSIKPVLNLPTGEYIWWVQTKNDDGVGPWSDGLSFNYLLNPPGIPTPISPAGLISAKTPKFKWTAQPTATKYELEVYRGFSENEILVYKGSFDAEKVTEEELCSALSPVVLLDEVYTWRIRARNDAGKGTWSEWQYFENVCALKPGAAKNKAMMARMING